MIWQTKNLRWATEEALLSLEEKEKILEAREIIDKKSLSVRPTEHATKQLKSVVKRSRKGIDNDLQYIADNL